MKKEFYDLVLTSEYLKNFPLIEIARIAIEFQKLGFLKEEYSHVPDLSE